jgi:RHS repeat-associated protein
VSGTPQSSDQLGNPWTYTGRFHDEETGLYYYRARYYSPEAGRFLQRDPIEYLGGSNLYEYCASGPVDAVDPMGLDGKPTENQRLAWGAMADAIGTTVNGLPAIDPGAFNAPTGEEGFAHDMSAMPVAATLVINDLQGNGGQRTELTWHGTTEHERVVKTAYCDAVGRTRYVCGTCVKLELINLYHWQYLVKAERRLHHGPGGKRELVMGMVAKEGGKRLAEKVADKILQAAGAEAAGVGYGAISFYYEYKHWLKHIGDLVTPRWGRWWAVPQPRFMVDDGVIVRRTSAPCPQKLGQNASLCDKLKQWERLYGNGTHAKGK